MAMQNNTVTSKSLGQTIVNAKNQIVTFVKDMPSLVKQGIVMIAVGSFTATLTLTSMMAAPDQEDRVRSEAVQQQFSDIKSSQF